MTSVKEFMDRMRSVDLERSLHLYPPHPSLALQIDNDSMSLVRTKPQRGKKPLLEVIETVALEQSCLPRSILEPRIPVIDGLSEKVRAMFERSGTKPGRVSIVVPDNLAKISLIRLPERPANRRQLDELVRAQMRRSVPFKLDEARLSYQVMHREGGGVTILVALVRRALVEPFERLLEEIDGTVGMFDLSTPNLINLCRAGMDEVGRVGGDAALLNCDQRYFTLAIIRREQLIFFRSKTYPESALGQNGPNGALTREVANSFSYYRDKLEGQGLQRIYVRSVVTPVAEIVAQLREMGLDDVRSVDPISAVECAPGVGVDEQTAQAVSPAIGAAVGRGR